jgi:hypothetical protein
MEENDLLSMDEIKQKIQVIEPEIIVTNLPTEQPKTTFADAAEKIKIGLLENAQENDINFQADIQNELKDALVEISKLEKQKAELEKQKLETQQKFNTYVQQSDAWTDKQNRREFHFNGVKPVMEYVGIRTPMCLVFLYLLTVIITPFFLISKLLKSTVGILINEAANTEKNSVRIFLWSVVGLIIAVLLAAIIISLIKII